ncbi:hypothetical protein ACFE04_029760 [Oxalis oulophora]
MGFAPTRQPATRPLPSSSQPYGLSFPPSSRFLSLKATNHTPTLPRAVGHASAFLKAAHYKQPEDYRNWETIRTRFASVATRLLEKHEQQLVQQPANSSKAQV